MGLPVSVDYCRLNSVTVKDSYPLPRIDDSINALSGSSWFSTLDLASGYWQVEVDEKDRPKRAFTAGSGLYQFAVMPFGLCNAPATFERLMERVLSGLPWEVCLLYLDDINDDRLKQVLSQAPVLAYPTSEGAFALDTDASNTGIGAVLSQKQGEEEKVIAYFSRSLTKSERQYCVTSKELLALVAAVRHFHHYVYGRHFKV